MGEPGGQGRPEVGEVARHPFKLGERDVTVGGERSGETVADRPDRRRRPQLAVPLEVHVDEVGERQVGRGDRLPAQPGLDHVAEVLERGRAGRDVPPWCRRPYSS